MSNPFQHITLSLAKDASIKKPKPRVIPKQPQTEIFYNNRKSHSQNLETARYSLSQDWIIKNQKRQQDNLPEMPEAVSIFLRIDPRELPIEKLKSYGIEVIGEFEDGFVIGSSSDLTLGDLAKKIQKFSAGGQHNVSGLWDIISGNSWRQERILSESLQKIWPSIKDHDQLVVEIGVACLGMKEVSEHPIKRRKTFKSQEAYEKAIDNWKRKRGEVYDEWDELAYSRYHQLMKIVSFYKGEDLSGYIEGEYDSETNLPDSFTVKLRVSGQCLRDIVENYPFVFDLSEADEIGFLPVTNSDSDTYTVTTDELIIEEPNFDSPSVCIIDSGIQERHPYLNKAIDSTSSRSWVGSRTDVADYVDGGGHGTSVAGAVLYSSSVPTSGTVESLCWIQNARVLEDNNMMPSNLFPPRLMRQIVDHFYYGERNTRIYNHSLNSNHPSRKIHMSAWAAAIDQLSWDKDVLFVISAGNLPATVNNPSFIRLSIKEHLNRGLEYPDYLFEPSSRIANPSQSLQGITVGSVGIEDITGLYNSFSSYSEPSSFSCAGPGIWNAIKPEVVEFGGCYAYDIGNPSNIMMKTELCPELISSTLKGGKTIRKNKVGTSFAAPKVSNILAQIQKIFPVESTLMYRALLVQSARWPEGVEKKIDKNALIRAMGYGIPDVHRATENTPYRITLITSGQVCIRGKQVHIYKVKIPVALRSPGDSHDIRVDITLSYKAQPRRTRRNRQRYLSTWLEWETSKLNENTASFTSRMVELASNEFEDLDAIEEGGAIKWAIGKQNNHGEIKGVHRNSGTLQRDWTIMKSYELHEEFCVAVIGHHGWSKDPEAAVPYALCISFESVNQTAEIYSQIELANRVEIEEEVQIGLF